jgi:hypothetical protein
VLFTHSHSNFLSQTMDLFNDNLHENDDLRMICEGSAPFNDNVFHELTSYLEVPNQCHSAAYGLPDFDDSMFALDTTSAINGGLTDSAGQSPGEDFPGGDFPGPEGSIVVGDNAKSRLHGEICC